MVRKVYGGENEVWCDLDEILHETDGAVRVQLKNEDEPRWIPKSEKVLIDINDEVVGVHKWFADKEGIQGDW